jgi:hypothetical protein
VKASGIPIPFCAFNGGHDVFLDVGNKALGIRALQTRLGVQPQDTMHAGDRFTRTGEDVGLMRRPRTLPAAGNGCAGNDRRAREVASTLWVDSPGETEHLLTLMIEQRRGVAAGRAASGACAGSLARAPHHTEPPPPPSPSCHCGYGGRVCPTWR